MNQRATSMLPHACSISMTLLCKSMKPLTHMRAHAHTHTQNQDHEDTAQVNDKLESMGYGIGQRLIDELLAKSNVGQVFARKI